MKLPEMIKRVAEVSELSKKDVETVLRAYTEVVKEGLKAEDEVPMVDGGKFVVTEKAERDALINPRQPELGKKKVPAHKAAKFKMGKGLKELLK